MVCPFLSYVYISGTKFPIHLYTKRKSIVYIMINIHSVKQIESVKSMLSKIKITKGNQLLALKIANIFSSWYA